jgi:hypothetical protein
MAEYCIPTVVDAIKDLGGLSEARPATGSTVPGEQDAGD